MVGRVLVVVWPLNRVGGLPAVTVGSAPRQLAARRGRKDARDDDRGRSALGQCVRRTARRDRDATPRRAAADAPAVAVRTRRARQQHKSFLRELPGIVITALVISVLIKTFLVQAFYIPSGSMENTLLVNDRVLVNKLADKPDEIHRGDVVVFRDPGGWLNGAGRDAVQRRRARRWSGTAWSSSGWPRRPARRT